MLTIAIPPPQAIVAHTGNTTSSPSVKEANYLDILNHPIKKFIDKSNLSKNQYKLLQDMYLISYSYGINTTVFNITVDNEEEDAVLTRKTNRSLDYLVIDKEGDVMISHISIDSTTPDYRKFFDFENADAEEILYLLLLNK